MEKTCAFYVSDLHFITMILPFLKKQLSTNNTKIETFFEKNQNKNLSKFLNNLIINNDNKNRILNINWNINNIRKYSLFEKNIKEISNGKKEIICLVSGDKIYINKINSFFDRFIKKYNVTNIKIINCYEISGFDDDIKDIIEHHKYLLNTSGVHKIEDVFEQLKNKQAN